MEFRIADTFTGSLARLTGDEQKAVKTTAFDLQLKPANPGMQFHREKSGSRNRGQALNVKSSHVPRAARSQWLTTLLRLDGRRG